MYPLFNRAIAEMNVRYQLPDIAPDDGSMPQWANVRKRLSEFKDILSKECAEIEDIEILADTADDANWPEVAVAVFTNLADLLGDIIVYCASEAQRWGIPLPEVLQIIMASNTSKLGADGKPIINPSNGKFEKGPNYWKPESAIQFLLTNPVKEWTRLQFTKSETGVTTLEILESADQPTAANETGVQK